MAQVSDWRRKWQPTPVFLPGESQGQRSLVGCGCTESDTTEVTYQQQQVSDMNKYLNNNINIVYEKKGNCIIK